MKKLTGLSMYVIHQVILKILTLSTAGSTYVPRYLAIKAYICTVCTNEVSVLC